MSNVYLGSADQYRNIPLQTIGQPVTGNPGASIWQTPGNNTTPTFADFMFENFYKHTLPSPSANPTPTFGQYMEANFYKNIAQDNAINANTNAIVQNNQRDDAQDVAIQNTLNLSVNTAETLAQFMETNFYKNKAQDNAINANTNAINQNNQRDDAQDATINNLAATVEELKEQGITTTITDDVTNIINNTVNTAITNNITSIINNAVNANSSEINAKNDSQDQQINNNSQTNANQDQQISSLNAQVSANTSALNANNQVDEQQSQQIDNNSQTNASQDQQISSLNDQVSANTSALNDNNQVDEQQSQQINNNNQTNASQDQQISSLNAQVSANTSALNDNNQVDTNQTQQISNLENLVNENTETINNNSQKNEDQDNVISFLQDQISSMQQMINTLLEKLNLNEAKDAAQDNAISQNSDQIVDLAEITNSELWLRNNIKSDELDIVTEKGIDLLEKDEDGNPQYLIAQGRTDGQYHIYEYNQDWGGDDAQYKSIINKYDHKNLKNGSNYLYVSKDAQVNAAEEATNAVQNNSINSEDWGYVKAADSYTTGSPLIFDTNGNGSVEAQYGIGVDLNENGNADGAAINGDKMLAMGDLNGNGKIDSAEVFGNETINPFTGEKLNANNGFDALKQIAELTQQKIGNTSIFNNGIVNIQALQAGLASQNIGLGLISDNNVTNLESLANIASVNTNYNDIPEESGDALHLQGSSYTTTDGEERKVHDVWFKLN